MVATVPGVFCTQIFDVRKRNRELPIVGMLRNSFDNEFRKIQGLYKAMTTDGFPRNVLKADDKISGTSIHQLQQNRCLVFYVSMHTITNSRDGIICHLN